MEKIMKIGNRNFLLGSRLFIMGILNVTPDSFSDGGRYNTVEAALSHGEKLVREGADILDIGGESTRPGHQAVTSGEEIERIIPVIRALKKSFDVPISVDTYKSQVAEEAVKAGADMINDVWGFRYDGKMADVAGKYQIPVCLMHNRQEPAYHYNILEEVFKDLKESVRLGQQAGVLTSQMILDPGIGFGKTYEMNLYLLNHLKDFKELGFPLLLGTSRKSVIGKTLLLPEEEREEGTLATTLQACMCGWDFVRVHDVEKNKRAITMAEAIKNTVQP